MKYPQPCTFCMSPSSITPDSTHQLISRDCKTWSGCVRYRETYKMCSAGGTLWRGLRTTDLQNMCVCVYRNVAPSVFITSPSLRYEYFFFWSPITSSCGGHRGSLLTLSSESATHVATLVRVSYRHHGFHTKIMIFTFTLLGKEWFESTNSHN